MNSGYSRLIRKRIDEAQEGTIFINSDFTDVADANTVRRTLNRLVSENFIRRLLNGIYDKPKYSTLLNEFVAPDPNSIAHALARCYHWSIAPSGNTALNLLGLSTQVTAIWSYISDGPYKTYDLNTTKIVFKHRTNKEITGLSYLSALVIQALKALGKDNVDEFVINTLSIKLSSKDKEALLRETTESTDWIFETIKMVCGGDQNQ